MKLIIVCSMIGVGVLAVLAALPVLSGRLKRGHWYGLRTDKTLASDRAWAFANRLLGIDLCVAGIATAGVSASMLLTRLDEMSTIIVAVYAIGCAAMCFGIAIGHAMVNIGRLK